MSGEWITLVEAFRVIVRASYPERPELADEVTHIHWFHHWASLGVPTREHAAAEVALETLRETVRNGKVRLRGVFNPTDPPADIDPIDAATGELRLFEAALVFYATGGLRVVKRYASLRCLAADVRGVARQCGTNGPTAPLTRSDTRLIQRL
jgi:hypothetical protein